MRRIFTDPLYKTDWFNGVYRPEEDNCAISVVKSRTDLPPTLTAEHTTLDIQLHWSKELTRTGLLKTSDLSLDLILHIIDIIFRACCCRVMAVEKSGVFIEEVSQFDNTFALTSPWTSCPYASVSSVNGGRVIGVLLVLIRFVPLFFCLDLASTQCCSSQEHVHDL